MHIPITAKRFKFVVLILPILLLLLLPYSAEARIVTDSLSVIRVGYIEGESYEGFSKGLAGIALGLQSLGIISGLPDDVIELDAQSVWQSLAMSDCEGIKFIENAFFSMKDSSDEDYAKFTNSDSVDILIVMGTVAGVYVSKHEDKNDYIVVAAANPVLSGIVKSETERYKANSYAYIDRSRLQRQIEVGYNILKFNMLGVVYENNSNSYAYSGIEQLEAASKKHGFKVIRRYVDEARNDSDQDRYYKELKDAYTQLIAEGIDALYVTTATTEDHVLQWLLEDLVKAGVPTISQVGESQVRNGVVLGVTLDDPIDQGRFIANRINEYMNGTPISDLVQTNEIVPKVYMNYDAAISSGIKLPFKVLLTMDEIFRSNI